MDFRAFLDELREEPGYAGQIKHVFDLPPREASFGELAAELAPPVQAILARLGLDRLWAHQAEAVNLAMNGQNVVIVSSTASGKTLCYTLPLAQRIAARATTRAFLIYPTKALAQDQLRKLGEFGAGEAFVAETYDGDTAASRRRRIRREAQVVLTNPDMLHLGILPRHQSWGDFFRRLEFVVLDEVHTYRGVFGSHTANVIRRLRRISRHYGADPQFICCSATIANPRELCEALTGLEFSLVDCDGAPQGRRIFAIWNPPVVRRGQGERRSANLEAAGLVAALMRRGVRSICFTLARRQAELILAYVRRVLRDSPLAGKVLAYRGGYLPKERRAIEKQLFEGELLAVTATTALELGVDIGGLDAAILTGYPGSIASTWQQAGRAGRGKSDALAVLIGLAGGIHQYLMAHPEYLLETASERAIIDPSNRFILAGHLLCAAYELAIRDRETELFGPQMHEILEVLAEHGYVTRRSAWYWVHPDVYPAAEVSIRSASGTAYDIVWRAPGREDTLLATMDAASAFQMVHPGAVYLHAGETFVVEELDLERNVAVVSKQKCDYYTVPLMTSEVRTGSVEAERALATGTALCLGEVQVKSAVIAYRRVRQVTDQDLGQFPLDLPPASFESVGAWIKLSEADVTFLEQAGHDLMGSLHALEHGLIQLLPLFALCDPHDVGGVSLSHHPDVGGPAIVLYDGYPGGVGICAECHERLLPVLAATERLLEQCPCEAGCPSCVQSPQCGDGNRPLDKAGARALAARWAAAENAK